MHILLTGTTGYIAKRLAIKLLEEGHRLTCCVRDLDRKPDELEDKANVSWLKANFLDSTLPEFPSDIDAAYYLIHSMSSDMENFTNLELKCAQNFKSVLEKTQCKQLIYLSGIVNDQSLSKHLNSRLAVEKALHSKIYATTTLRAGIIVGSGSASFEIIRDIVEKLPVMVTPKWLNTKSHPIAIRDVMHYLNAVLDKKELYNGSFDIYGPEVLTYKEMLLQFAKVRGLKRYIWTLPVLTPKLSSYWLYFVTSTSFALASSLVDSMKVEVVGKTSVLQKIVPHNPMSYKHAVNLAFQRIQQNEVVSSWKDAVSSGVFNAPLSKHIQVPVYGCFKDLRIIEVQDEAATLDRIWRIGGENGWYSFNLLWKIRGYLDKLFGGVGLRRGRTHKYYLEPGDPLDFWRVLYADRTEKRLLLFAEMKLPGEAWLEFSIRKGKLYQRAVYRPKGLLGRLYWYAVLPAHGFVFNGMIKALAGKK